ncbi:flagellar hook-associated protein FlgK [Pullulanibacillus sp. KACC 23026]|uniref:flagellar hook-associated protein FlgK n=1 Tax=Pullulanibacillus sp. KACC 23026 TaxID=3028315 RepID=UPI0023B16B77|nr:flagellar hook-associated protein FlgK [Pullulanibacillus sp. KACC 23026]WEG11247.1 flagellar hook-associated protein FlgK [Pullulanibacillus sp. KACC 23026]
MTSTFLGLEIGKRGLAAQQAALTTTGHNIANANTPGYTRQSAVFQATNAIPVAGLSSDTTTGQLGTGVEVAQITRLRDSFLDTQYRNENTDLGYWTAKSDTYTKIEDAINEPSDQGLAATMDTFFESWQELANDPDSSSTRAVVRQDAVAVTDSFNAISSSLDQMQSDLHNVITTNTDDVNSLATQIANLNDQISRLVPNDYQPNDLYDQRDNLIDQLSNLVDVQVTPGDSGMVNISVGSGSLVSGKTSNTLSVGFDSDSGLVDPDQIEIGGNKVTLQSGELLGDMESYGILGQEDQSIIPSMKAKINSLATTFADAVNTAHKNGLNLDNINGVSDEKVDFFVGTSAGDMQVNPEIMNSLNLIAAAKVESDGQSSTGNGQNAMDIYNIKSTNLNFPGTTTNVDDYYQNIVGQLGIDSQESQRMEDNAQTIVQQVDNRRQSVSGVSLDEEMTNMIRFQQAYNSSARMVSVMNDCLDKIINGMGQV